MKKKLDRDSQLPVLQRRKNTACSQYIFMSYLVGEFGGHRQIHSVPFLPVPFVLGLPGRELAASSFELCP